MNFVSFFAQMLTTNNKNVYELFIVSLFFLFFYFFFLIIAQLAVDFFKHLILLLNISALTEIDYCLSYSNYVQDPFSVKSEFTFSLN